MARHRRVIWSHVWRWRRQLPERYGDPCRIAAFNTGKRGGTEVVVEFQDGTRILVARSAVRARRHKPLTLSHAPVGG